MIHHVGLELRAEDLERAREFWARVGFAEVAPPEGLADRSVWVEAPGPGGAGAGATQIHLQITPEPVVPGLGHVAVVVAEFEATVAGLVAAGYEVEPRRRHWGAARAFASHPGGHTVELMAAPPPPADTPSS